MLFFRIFATIAKWTPKSRYQQDIKQGIIQADPEQARALAVLERIHQQVQHRFHRSLWHKIKALGRGQAPVRGAYLWGGVGHW